MIIVDCRTEELDFVRGDYDNYRIYYHFIKQTLQIREIILHRSILKILKFYLKSIHLMGSY